MSMAGKNNSRYHKREEKVPSASESFTICISPVTFRQRLIDLYIPKMKNHGFFTGINVNSAVSSSKKKQFPEKLPNIYHDNDSIYDTQYQELVDCVLEKSGKTFQFEKFVELHDVKREAESVTPKNFKVCGRFNRTLELRARSLLPQTLAKLKGKRPLKKAKLNIDGIPAMAYQR